LTPTVLVTDGGERAALAVTRSLGQAGWRVIVVARERRTVAGASRWCAKSCIAPDPVIEPVKFARAIAALVEHESVDLVLPIGEGALLALAADRVKLGRAVLPWPALPIIRRTLDKSAVLAAAGACGLAIPAQQECADAIAVAGAAAALGFPLVLKPARSIGEADGARRKVGVVHAATRDELASELANACAGVASAGAAAHRRRWHWRLRIAVAGAGARDVRPSPTAGEAA